MLAFEGAVAQAETDAGVNPPLRPSRLRPPARPSDPTSTSPQGDAARRRGRADTRVAASRGGGDPHARQDHFLAPSQDIADSALTMRLALPTDLFGARLVRLIGAVDQRGARFETQT